VRPLRADFARPPAWPVASLWLAVALILALAAGMGLRDLQLGRRLQEARSQTHSIMARMDDVRAEQSARAASAAQPPAFSADARRLMALSTFDAAGVLRSVEAVQMQGAKLARLDLDATTRHVEIELDVANADVATAYVQALNAGLDRPLWTLSRFQAQGASLSALIRCELP